MHPIFYPRFLAALLILFLGIGPSPAFGLRQMPDQAGLEEALQGQGEARRRGRSPLWNKDRAISVIQRASRSRHPKLHLWPGAIQSRSQRQSPLGQELFHAYTAVAQSHSIPELPNWPSALRAAGLDPAAIYRYRTQSLTSAGLEELPQELTFLFPSGLTRGELEGALSRLEQAQSDPDLVIQQQARALFDRYGTFFAFVQGFLAHPLWDKQWSLLKPSIEKALEKEIYLEQVIRFVETLLSIMHLEKKHGQATDFRFELNFLYAKLIEVETLVQRDPSLSAPGRYPYALAIAKERTKKLWEKEEISFHQRQVMKKAAQIREVLADLWQARPASATSSIVYLGLGPTALRRHGPEAMEFLEYLEEQVPNLDKLLILVGEEAPGFLGHPAVAVAAETPQEAADALRGATALGALTPERLIYVSTDQELQALKQLFGTANWIEGRPLTELAVLLKDLLNLLGRVDPSLLHQSQADLFSGINFNDLAEHLEALSHLGV